jgi:TldD protein
MKKLTPALMEELVAALVSSGGEYADVYFQDSSARHVEAEEGRIEKVSTARERGVGFHLIRDGVRHFAATVDLKPDSLLEMARSLASGAGRVNGGSPVKVTGASPGPLPMGADPSEVSLTQKAELVMEALRAAQGYDDRIVQVKTLLRDSVSHMMVATSEGVLTEDHRAYGVFLAQAVASDGEHIQSGYEPVGGIGGYDLFRDFDAAAVGETSARRAITMLEAPEAPAGKMTVVLSSEAGGTMVHEAVGHGLEADLAGQNLSVYSGKLGEMVGSEIVTVVDDPTLPGRRGSYNYDDEGEKAEKTVLVDRGRLVAYMTDRYTCLRDGFPSSGNGRRQSFRHWPIPRMSNTIIEPGSHSPAEIVRSVDRGLFVRKMGGGQVNTVSGDFVFEVSEGYLIEKGEVGGAVRGATLAGNGPEVLKSVDMVGDDLGFGLGTCGKDGQGVPVGDAQPTLRLPDIVVGGRDAGS